jgi:hypothetical protein
MSAANPEGASGSLETAAESFGTLLDIEDGTVEATEAPDEVVEEPDEQEPEEESSDTEEESEDTEEESEEEPGDSEESEEEKFERLTELAEALEMPIEDFMASIKTTVKVNGEEKEVSLSDLKNGFQMESDYRQKTADLAEQRRAFEAEQARKIQEIQSHAEQSIDLADVLEQQLSGEYESVNWNQLRSESPAEYAALKQEYNDRFSQIQQLKESVKQNQEFAQREMLTKQFEYHQNVLKEEGSKLLEAIPEWHDSDKAKTGKTELASYLKSEYGFDDQAIGNLIDHRSVVIARKAMLYDRMNNKAKVAEKKVSKLPKIMKPGAKKGKDEVKSYKRTEQLKRLRKSGHVNDAAELFKELIE